MAQLFICNIYSNKLKVSVKLEGQTIKWSLASINIINRNFLFIYIIKKVCWLSMMLFRFCLMGESVLFIPIDHQIKRRARQVVPGQPF